MRSQLHSGVKRKGLDGRHVRSLPKLLAEEARFFKAWVENPVATGAVSPSGKALARAMARNVDPAISGPVLELGPGTGPVTQALIDHGIAPERLILIEYDPAFCKMLERKFPAATIVHGDAYHIKATLGELANTRFAAIVSSLPLLNRPEQDRLDLVREAFELLDPRGNLIQFTYGMVSPVPRRSKTAHGVAFNATASAPVWLNLPPARVWSYRPAGETSAVLAEPATNMLMGKIKERSYRVRDELLGVRDDILEQKDRIETEFRLVRDRMRIDFELRAAHLRRELEMKPAMVLLKKLGQNRRKIR